MAKNIEPKLKKIGDYLTLEDDYIFRIPEYQRPYSWEITQCEKLWQDIIDYIESGRRDGHFFGTIIINSNDNEERYELIDGQQRTTTFLLLLKAILLKVNEALDNSAHDEDSASLRLALQDRRRKIMSILCKKDTDDISNDPDPVRDSEICGEVVILENLSINEHDKNKADLGIILKATTFDAVARSVRQIPYKQKDNRYTNFYKNFKFFYNKITELRSDSKLNAIAKAFTETCEIIEIKSWKMNQAINMFNCLNSDGLPLSDADILSAKMYGAAKDVGQEGAFAELWKELDDILKGSTLDGIIDINALFMQHMYYVRAVNKETITASGTPNVTTPGMRRYFTEDNRAIINDPLKMGQQLLKLAKIWEKVAEYNVTKVLLKFNENSKLFLASYFYSLEADEITEDIVRPVLESMLRLFAILELVDAGYSSKNFKTFLFSEQVKFVDATITSDEIKEDFYKHISAQWGSKQEEIKESLLAYDGYTLVYLNEYLFAREKGITFNLGSKYDIEHIMPYSGHNISQIRVDAEIDSEEEFYGIVNKLGNKIVLESKINRGIGNDWFSSKVSATVKNKTGYQDSEYPIATALVAKYNGSKHPFWKKDDISAATEKASERIAKFIFGD